MEKEQLITLVSNAQNGDQNALNELFNAFYNDLYYFALKTVKDDDLALDITQEAFVEIINTLGNLKEPAAFVTWAKQITYHQCTRYFKKKKDVIVSEDEEGHTVFDNLEEENAEFIPEEALDKDDFKKTILAILDELSEEQRSATMMYYFDEMSVKEIAEIQGVSEGTIKSRLNYSRKAIKASVEEYEKKNNVKLHALPFFPFFKWLFEGSFSGGMPIASASAVAEGVTAATGSAVALSATGSTVAVSAATATTVTTTAAVGIGAKIAALPIALKAIAAAVAATVVIGGTSAAVILSNNSESNNKSNESSSQKPANEELLETAPNPGVEPLLEELYIPKGYTYTLADGEVLQAGEAYPKVCTKNDRLEGEFVYYIYEPDNLVTVYGSADPEPSEMWIPFLKNNTSEKITLFKTINKKSVYPDTDTYKQIMKAEKEEVVAIEKIPAFVVPKGAIYQTANGDVFKEKEYVKGLPTLGDELITEDYIYKYGYRYECFSDNKKITSSEWIEGVGEGWGMRVRKTDKTSYSPLLSFINNKPLLCINYAFANCRKMTKAPEIPKGIQEMVGAFLFCESMTESPKLPEGISTLYLVYSGCKSLKTAPVIPVKVENLMSTFVDCTSLTEAPAIPHGVWQMCNTFVGCTSLRSIPFLPKLLTDMSCTFSGCSALLKAPEIPANVTNMQSAFVGCTSLIDPPPVIPNTVTNLNAAFSSCVSLTGNIIINAKTLTSEAIENCFEGTQYPITISGKSPHLDELAATAQNGNVTVSK